MTPDEFRDIDQWFVRNVPYMSALAIIPKGKDPQTVRRAELVKFFRVAQKAENLKNATLKPAKGNPWESPDSVHKRFEASLKDRLKDFVEAPRIALEDSLFSRGMHVLQETIGIETFPITAKKRLLKWEKQWKNHEKTLRRTLQIDKMRDILKDIRKTGNVTKISAVELSMATKIQKAIQNVPYEEDTYKPQAIRETQVLNCVGGSILGGAFLGELGIRYVVGDLRDHSMLIVVTQDDNVYLRDMIGDYDNMQITRKNLLGVTPQDIAAFSKSPTSKGLLFQLSTRSEGIERFAIFGPEYGQKIQTLFNIGCYMNDFANSAPMLERKKLREFALACFARAALWDPQCADIYYEMGLTNMRLDRWSEALTNYRKAIKLDPLYKSAYTNVKFILHSLGRIDEAQQVEAQWNKVLEDWNKLHPKKK